MWSLTAASDGSLMKPTELIMDTGHVPFLRLLLLKLYISCARDYKLYLVSDTQSSKYRSKRRFKHILNYTPLCL